MKIISKFKDYYDYLTGIYGVDPLVTYERKPLSTISNNVEDLKNCDVITFDRHCVYVPDGYTRLIFHICNKVYVFHYLDNVLYYTEEELVRLYDLIKGHSHKTMSFIDDKLSYLAEDLYQIYGYKIPNKWYYSGLLGRKNKNYTKTMNENFNCPLILVKRNDSYLLNPKLDTFQINKIIPAHDMFLMISQFLSKKDIEMPKDPTDMSRYEGKGFDKKTSFRNIK